MKIAIVGFDIEGKASYDYLTRLGGHDITVCDQNSDIAVTEDVKTRLGKDYLKGLDEFDCIVRTAGLHPQKILDENPSVKERITTHINLFFGAVPPDRIIAVTGTKGKGTTSSLIAAMLKAAGTDVYLGGNIGVPPLTFLDKLTEDSWVVLELSSFQLIDLRYSPRVATCLMVVPEHLNWHADMEEYLQAKQQLFRWQQADDIAVYYPENQNSIAVTSVSAGRHLPYYRQPGAYVSDGNIVMDGQIICAIDELKLLGRHNWQNACAAVTVVWQVTQDVEAIKSVLTSFTGLEHRLEFVRVLKGVGYYDDSFGTTPETAIVAIEAFSQPKIVILGGSDKGADYNELARAVADGNVRQVVLIGEQAGRIKIALENAGFHDFKDGGTNMSQTVQAAQSVAQEGDIVLLSTGCASFDMFKNYKDRGDQFKQAVSALA